MSAAYKSSQTMRQGHFRPRKTKLCSFWQVGRCLKGQDCAFAHGGVELEAPPDFSKTSICIAWKVGTCQLSAAECRFAHGKQDLRTSSHLKQSRQDDDFSPEPFMTGPPGLQGAEDPAPPAWDAAPSDLEPMKVPSPSPAAPVFEPMKVTTPSFIGDIGGLWDWEGDTVAPDDTVALETSSDDGRASSGSHSSATPKRPSAPSQPSSAPSRPLQPEEAVEYHCTPGRAPLPPIGVPVTATSGTKYHAASSSSRPSGGYPLFAPARVEVGGDADDHGSLFSGMPWLS